MSYEFNKAKLDALRKAIHEANRFLEAAKSAQLLLEHDRLAGISGSKEMAAVVDGINQLEGDNERFHEK